MKVLWSFFIILLLCSASAWSRDVQADSLKASFLRAKTPKERMRSCLNLDNYYRNYLFIDSVPLTRTLLEEGIQSKNEYVIADALRKLVMGIPNNQRVLTNDSVTYYLDLADKFLTGERKQSFITEVHLRDIRSLADWTKDESKTIEVLTSRYTTANEKTESIYFQIERYYALGMAGALCISDYSPDAYQNSLRYFERLFELIQKVPIEYGAEILFWVNENIYLSYLNSKNDQQGVDFIEKMMEILKRYKELPEVKADVYQNFEFVYTLYYWGISHSPAVVGHQRAFDSLTKMDVMHRKRGNLLSLYFAYKGFYEDVKDYKMRILYCDSVIHFMKNNDRPSAKPVIASMYQDQAESYAILSDYKRAYELMRKNRTLQEKIVSEESKQLRADMDARYDLSHLELEKERLTSENRRVALFSTLFVFVLSVAWGISQRYHLNRLKKMQNKLIESNKEVMKQSERAQESEKMKTAFINSICHEIRTPLNAINGFSSLLLDESIDAECKVDFPDLISKNTDLLTRLLDNMLEVSNLSSSAEELPMEEADVHAVFEQEVEIAKSLGGTKIIQYQIEIADDCRSIRTNVPYLSQTISHLLENANKFTESGQISLVCCRDAFGHLVIKVNDTGIGIPLDKQEWVFERFTKIDDFKTGTGLGLYVCRLIIKRLGGTIHIDNQYTKGTSIVITFFENA